MKIHPAPRIHDPPRIDVGARLTAPSRLSGRAWTPPATSRFAEWRRPGDRRPARRARALSGFLPRAVAVLLLLANAALAADTVLFETNSAFNLVVVTENSAGVRSLKFARDGALQSVGKPDDPDHLALPYVRAVFVSLTFVEKPRRALVVGLGGGSIPRFLHKHYPDLHIDCVELDPEVIAVARRFFGLVEDRTLQAHAGDGRKFIEQVKQPYDLIFLDAFGADSIPYRLATREFLVAARKALTPRGIVVGNVWSRYSNPLYDSMVRTYQDVFDELYLFTVSGSGNRILIGLPRPTVFTREDVVARATVLGVRDRFPYPLADAASYGFARLTGERVEAPVLLDAHPPPKTDP